MPTYLYCVLPTESEVLATMPRGFDGAVRALDAGAVTAWVETVPDAAITPTVDRVRIHDAVTDAALATGATPIPARFGQLFATDDACHSALITRAVRLRADLARVAGLVEMRVIAKLTVTTPPESSTEWQGARDGVARGVEGAGRAYLEQLRGRRIVERNLQAISAAVRQRLTETVGAFVRGEAISLDPLPAAVLYTAHLVPRDAVSQYRSALHGATLGPDVERIVVSGPSAPYAFASEPNE
jgi:hypothetical protein